MKRVKIGDLKNNLSRYLSYVRDGGELLVLDREVPIARVLAYGMDRAGASTSPDGYWNDERLARLERQGTVVRPQEAGRQWIQSLRPAKLPAGAPSAVELLLQTRRESAR